MIGIYNKPEGIILGAYEEQGRLMLFNDKDLELVKSWINNPKIANFELIYKASVDGFQVSKFHDKCDDQDTTISFV